MVERPQTVIPNPDPSEVTSSAIDRRVANAEAVMNARLDGVEKAVEVFQADLTRVPTQLDRAIQGLRDLIEARLLNLDESITRYRLEHQRLLDEVREIHISGRELAALTNQRFIGVVEQFKERDTRTAQRAGDTKLAVDAAFAAAKEATSKIEAGFTKSIDGQQELLTAQTTATNDKISDLKDRLTAIENRTAGITSANQENRSVTQDSSARLLAGLSIVVATLVGIGTIIAAKLHTG